MTIDLCGLTEGYWSKSYVQGEGILSVLKEGYKRVSPWPFFECNKPWKISSTSIGNDRKKFTRKDKIS